MTLYARGTEAIAALGAVDLAFPLPAVVGRWKLAAVTKRSRRSINRAALPSLSQRGRARALLNPFPPRLHETAVLLGILCLKGFKMAFEVPVEGPQERPDPLVEAVGQAPHSGCCENLERH